MPLEPSHTQTKTAASAFSTTHWSVVLGAGYGSESAAQAALERLCRTYWYPLYAYLRRRGYGHEDAEDLTQGFLIQLLERKSFTHVERNRGRFRSFLLAGLNYYMSDQRDRATALKRGAGKSAMVFDAQTAEGRYRLEPMDDDSPDRVFERRWALALLDQVLQRLEQEFLETSRGGLFERLQVFLVAGRGEASYAEAAAALGMSQEAVRKAVQRLRLRYQELFREEIAHTVANPEEVEEELRHLCDIITTR